MILQYGVPGKKTLPESEPIQWHDIRKPPFALHGLYDPLTEKRFHRLPEDVARATSEGVSKLQWECAGGRVRFSTDSDFIALRVTYHAITRASHMTLVASAGFDLYADGPFGSRYIADFRVPYEADESGFQQVIVPPENGMTAYTVNFPIHSSPDTVEIGLRPGALLAAEAPYRALLPVLFYGSSIVHGTAAGRPGLTYESIISRRLNIDYLNLGFSGKALGEAPLARYMATLPMSVFVCDYDHNAPTPEYLAETHFPLYAIIRERNPDLPYVMITRPNYYTAGGAQEQEDRLRRRDVVMRSYLRAREAGDQNVYFIDGLSFFADENVYDCTQDHVHPNGAGFLRMADGIGTVLRHILEKRG